MGACAQRNVDLAFFTPRGRFLARSVGETKGNVLLRQQQFRAADDPRVSCRYAKGFLLGKIYNARSALQPLQRWRSLPSRGAWIEICFGLPPGAAGVCRSPRGERG